MTVQYLSKVESVYLKKNPPLFFEVFRNKKTAHKHVQI